VSTDQLTSTDPASGPHRNRTRVVIASVVGVVVLLGAALVVGRINGAALSPPGETVGTQLNTPVPASIASLPLVDEYGHTTSLAAFHGKTVVLTDFMTLCQEVCPITTAELNEADSSVIKAGLSSKVQFVEITVDPERDTPDQLHAYRAFADLHPNFSLLTGTAANLATLWKSLGVAYEKQPEDNPPGINWRTGQPMTYDIGHSDVLMYLDANGNERYIIEGMSNGTTAPLTAGERSFLDDEGRANLTDTADATWTEPQALQTVSWLVGKHLKN
jgi:protein SCO1/2